MALIFFKTHKILIASIITILVSCSPSTNDRLSESQNPTLDPTKFLTFISVDGVKMAIELIESSPNYEINDIPKSENYEFTNVLSDKNSFTGKAGAVGILTDPLAMPVNGVFLYNGEAFVSITDNIANYALEGKARATLSFEQDSAGEITAILSQMNGFQTTTDLSTANNPVFDVAQIEFSNLSICEGNKICNGDAIIQSNILSSLLSGQELVNFLGMFSGPKGSEIAASFSVDDLDQGELSLYGFLIAKQ